MKEVVCGAILIKYETIKKILLVRKSKGDIWFLPGGKLEKNELDLECLARELNEEINIKLSNVKKIGKVQGISPYSKNEINITLYFAETFGVPIPNNEITHAKYFNVNNLPTNISDPTKDCFLLMKEKKYI